MNWSWVRAETVFSFTLTTTASALSCQVYKYVTCILMSQISRPRNNCNVSRFVQNISSLSECFKTGLPHCTCTSISTNNMDNHMCHNFSSNMVEHHWIDQTFTCNMVTRKPQCPGCFTFFSVIPSEAAMVPPCCCCLSICLPKLSPATAKAELLSPNEITTSTYGVERVSRHIELFGS